MAGKDCQDKNSGLLDPFVSYKENEVLEIRPPPFKYWSAHMQVKFIHISAYGCSVYIERAWARQNTGMTLLEWVYNILNVLIKILFYVDWKHSSFWPLADVKPQWNDLVHVMPVHVSSLLCIPPSLWRIVKTFL